MALNLWDTLYNNGVWISLNVISKARRKVRKPDCVAVDNVFLLSKPTAWESASFCRVLI